MKKLSVLLITFLTALPSSSLEEKAILDSLQCSTKQEIEATVAHLISYANIFYECYEKYEKKYTCNDINMLIRCRRCKKKSLSITACGTFLYFHVIQQITRCNLNFEQAESMLKEFYQALNSLNKKNIKHVMKKIAHQIRVHCDDCLDKDFIAALNSHSQVNNYVIKNN
jgi:predicted transcriptional regulator